MHRANVLSDMLYQQEQYEKDYVGLTKRFIRDRKKGHKFSTALVRHCLFDALYDQLPFFFSFKACLEVVKIKRKHYVVIDIS